MHPYEAYAYYIHIMCEYLSVCACARAHGSVHIHGPAARLVEARLPIVLGSVAVLASGTLPRAAVESGQVSNGPSVNPTKTVALRHFGH